MLSCTNISSFFRSIYWPVNIESMQTSCFWHRDMTNLVFLKGLWLGENSRMAALNGNFGLWLHLDPCRSKPKFPLKAFLTYYWMKYKFQLLIAFPYWHITYSSVWRAWKCRWIISSYFSLILSSKQNKVSTIVACIHVAL